MDSLLANYASSDEEEEEEQGQPPSPERTAFGPPKVSSENSFAELPPPPSSATSSLFSALPKPKSSSSLFQSLPPPERTLAAKPSAAARAKPLLDDEDDDGEAAFSKPASGSSAKSSSLFSKLPQPKSQFPPRRPSPSSSEPNSKRVVQFKPPSIPMKPSGLDDDDDEDERRDEERKRRDGSENPHSSTVKSFLSGVLPAPKHSATLGVLPTSGSGRRSIIDTQASASNSEGYRTENDGVVDQITGSYGNHDNSASYQQYDNYGNYQNAGYGDASYGSYGNYHAEFDQNVGVSGPLGPSQASVADTSTDGNYDGYASYVDYGQYGNEGVTDGSVAAVPEEPSGFRVTTGKKKRNEIPTEIVEVKQDELMKNRPREDQAKLTGIAFGPTYQPVSTKGKPSKLHKRKHQIGSLFFDMKQKEMELAERRSRGFLTKAETQAKYGW